MMKASYPRRAHFLSLVFPALLLMPNMPAMGSDAAPVNRIVFMMGPMSSSLASNSGVNFMRIKLGTPKVLFTGNGSLTQKRTDSAFTLLQQSSGSLVEFTSYQKVNADIVPDISHLGTVPYTPVLTAGANPPWDSNWSSAGDWLNAVYPVGDKWYGLVHEETSASYGGVAHDFKSMAMFTSTNDGKFQDRCRLEVSLLSDCTLS